MRQAITKRQVRVAECFRCGHQWIPRAKTPKRCASCRSPYWNKPRQKRGK